MKKKILKKLKELFSQVSVIIFSKLSRKPISPQCGTAMSAALDEIRALELPIVLLLSYSKLHPGPHAY
jgi:hypothetical protein